MTDLTTLTIEELKQGREETFSEEMLQDIDAELRRREQAQHTPADRALAIAQGEAECREQAGPTPLAGNLRPVDIRKDNDTWLLLYADRETAYLAAEAAARAPELAAENERLLQANKDAATNFLASLDSWQVQYELSRERGARIIELEREVERLRGLLAQCVAAFDAVIDNQVVTDEQFAAIEAAKEASNAR